MVLGLALFAGSTAPAQAAQSRALPADQGLYTLPCGGPANQLYSLDAAGALASPVGPGDSVGQDENECSVGAAFDPMTGAYLYLQYADLQQGLRSIDPVSGVSVDGPQLRDGEAAFTADAMAIGADGSAYVLSSRLPDLDNPDTGRTGLFSLDIETGEVDFIATIGGPDDYFAAFSFDPVSGGFYVISADGAVATVDLNTGTLTEVGTLSLTENGSTTANIVQSLTIDRDGTFWIVNVERVEGPERLRTALWSVDRGNLSSGSQLSGAIRTGDSTDDELFVQTIFVGPARATPAPAPAPAQAAQASLAETGVDEAAAGISLSFATLALLIGAAALATARVRRKAHV